MRKSNLHLCQTPAELKGKHVNLQVLDQNINTADAMGPLFFNMLGAIAQFEIELRAERQKGWHSKSKGAMRPVW